MTITNHKEAFETAIQGLRVLADFEIDADQKAKYLESADIIEHDLLPDEVRYEAERAEDEHSYEHGLDCECNQ